MVLINDKKYACATCIKGHRVSGCTHTDRPLFEVKKKGRPATQCQFCREKRKAGGTVCGSGSVHTKCSCGDMKNQMPATLQPNATAALLKAAATSSSPAPPTETKKGQPGSTPTFPNGLRDVHEMAAAAEALADLGTENNVTAQRDLENLLNPCNCRVTGRCRCCAPKRPRSPPASPRRNSEAHHQVTDSLIEMFKSKATTSAAPPSNSSEGRSGSSTPLSATSVGLQHLAMTKAQLSSPDNRHHPAHTSPFVHKTRLYSPYSTNGHSTPRHASGKTRSESVSSVSSNHRNGSVSGSVPSPRPPPPRLRPLTDMNRFLGAVFQEDGSIATEIPRSALGLPGIHTFDAAARDGGAKVEPMEMDVDAPMSFPTSEELVIGTCTCGDGCECAGCATHGNPRSSSSSPKRHEGPCGDNCKSCFNCGEHLSIPSGVTSIEQLIQIAAAGVPQPPITSPTALNAFDTTVLPPAAHMSEDVGRAFGVVQLKPLECCNGRCQCAPGECTCDKECCGCCKGCDCDHDGDTVMADEDGAAPAAEPERSKGCCGGGEKEPTPPVQAGPSRPTNLTVSPTTMLHGPGLPSPGAVTPPNGVMPSVRRTSSVSRAKEATNNNGRRMSASSTSSQASVQRSTSIGSKTTKSLAISPHHQHPRPILPKPASGGQPARLAPPRVSSSGSRQPSPVHRSRASSQASSQGSPLHPSGPLPAALSETAAPPPEEPAVTAQDQPPDNRDLAGGDMTIGVDDIASALAASDVDFMTYLNQVLSVNETDNVGNAGASTAFSLGQEAPGAPDLSLLQSMGTAPRGAPGSPGQSYGDIQQLIAGALAQQGVFGHRPASPPHHQHQQQQSQQQQQQQPDLSYFLDLPAPSSGDMTPARELAGFQFPTSNLDLSTLQQPAPAIQQYAPPSGEFDSNLLYAAYAGSLQLPLPQLQTNSDSGRSSANVEAAGPDSAPAPPTSHTGAPGLNPDIIDLSKPLNSSDIDRIMQALLMQQARQAGSAGPSTQQQQPPQPPPFTRSPIGSISDPFQQLMIQPPQVPNQQQQQSNQHQQQSSVLPERADGDWLQKAWGPSMLGPAVQPE